MTINPMADVVQVESADQYVGELINQLMWRHKVSRKDLGELLGVEGPTVSRKLRGERSWTLDELIAVSRRFGVSIESLMPGDDYAPVLSGRGRGGRYAIRDSNPEPAD